MRWSALTTVVDEQGGVLWFANEKKTKADNHQRVMLYQTESEEDMEMW